MSNVGPFNREFWIEDEVTYEHRPNNVVHLNTPHARAHAIANAAQGAMSLEQNRSNMRIDLWNDLSREKRQLLERLGQIEVAMAELAG